MSTEPTASVPWARIVEEGLVLVMQVVPGASRSRILGAYGDALRVAVAVAPDRGRANKALCVLLGDAFGVPSRDVEVRVGHGSRTKLVAVRTPAPELALAKMAGALRTLSQSRRGRPTPDG